MFTVGRLASALVATILGMALAAPAMARSAASDAFDQSVANYANVEQLSFTDDHTNVAGKAYDFTKARER